MFCLPLYSVACSTLIDSLYPSLLGRVRESLYIPYFFFLLYFGGR